MVLGSIAGSGNVPGRRDRDSAEQKIRRQGTGKDSIPAADGSNTGSNRNGMDADLPADNWYCKLCTESDWSSGPGMAGISGHGIVVADHCGYLAMDADGHADHVCGNQCIAVGSI